MDKKEVFKRRFNLVHIIFLWEITQVKKDYDRSFYTPSHSLFIRTNKAALLIF